MLSHKRDDASQRNPLSPLTPVSALSRLLQTDRNGQSRIGDTIFAAGVFQLIVNGVRRFRLVNSVDAGFFVSGNTPSTRPYIYIAFSELNKVALTFKIPTVQDAEVVINNTREQ